ncbi:acyltransferase family protein [Arcicella rigui]|uniref:Heparan-alpha-glucosaminide N-acetyltransferase domain-containing protein n=1 Tax=Arcicella rigui TaxID=797020 RepID=A0ABU5Q6N0_9BACT|nr:heparan-alpha-glucosaminide N-acetyltransferase domain-containing protein [Arcicella rigui]MEA5138302.1 heparan-alpha-glucosaminide N-acetyltransferase domain-containing protein [Arcicella rigui]
MKQRLLSLDVFRGLTVAMMILVNNPGDWGHIYAPLEHAEWNGCTPTDLVFPFFLFIVGVSISFAFQGKVADRKTILKIIERSIKLFALGIFLSLFPKFDFSIVRIPGVLQRIAIVFLVSAIVFLTTKQRTQQIIFASLLIGYWLLMTFVPVPDAGAANLEPEHNLGAYLDRLLLGVPHLYKAVKVWDPEGILSTLPAIANGLAGVLVGTWLQRNDKSVSERLMYIYFYGSIALALAWAWDAAGFPINKSLWTSSYSLWTIGLAMFFLAGFYWLIDVKGYKFWTKPFVVYGVNAITVFFLSGLIPRIMNMIKVEMPDGEKVSSITWLYQSFIVPFFSEPKNASLAGAITFVLIWLGILWAMYEKKIIVKV